MLCYSQTFGFSHVNSCQPVFLVVFHNRRFHAHTHTSAHRTHAERVKNSRQIFTTCPSLSVMSICATDILVSFPYILPLFLLFCIHSVSLSNALPHRFLFSPSTLSLSLWLLLLSCCVRQLVLSLCRFFCTSFFFLSSYVGVVSCWMLYSFIILQPFSNFVASSNRHLFCL